MKKLLVVLVMLASAVGIYLRADSDNEPRGPVIVAKYSAFNQSAPITAITEAHPLVDTGYIGIVHGVLHGSCNPGCPNARPKISYTDTDGNLTSFGGFIGPAPPSDTMFFFMAKGGTDVQFSSDWANITGSGSYDVTLMLMKVN